MIFRDLATTGDGLLTGVQLLDVVVRTGTPLAVLAGAVTRLPQVLRNVAVRAVGVDLAALIGPELARAEAELGDHGRVLVRPSGTEPLVRVMVEAPTPERGRGDRGQPGRGRRTGSPPVRGGSGPTAAA